MRGKRAPSALSHHATPASPKLVREERAPFYVPGPSPPSRRGRHLLFPRSFPLRPKAPLTFSSSAAPTAGRGPPRFPPPQPPGWVQPAASSRRELPGITGLSMTLRLFPMSLVLGARCVPAEGDLWEGKKRGAKRGEERGGRPSAPLRGGGCVAGVGAGWWFLL